MNNEMKNMTQYNSRESLAYLLHNNTKRLLKNTEVINQSVFMKELDINIKILLEKIMDYQNLLLCLFILHFKQENYLLILKKINIIKIFSKIDII